MVEEEPLTERILGDSWYASSVRDMCQPLDRLMEMHCPPLVRRLAARPGIVRSLCLFWFGRRYDWIVCTQRTPGVLVFLLLEAVLCRGHKRVVLLEFMPAPLRGYGPKRWLRRVRRDLLNWCTRRCVIGAHVLSMWEKEHYSAQCRVPLERFTYIPWPLSRETDPTPIFVAQAAGLVVSSGRFSCDWQTLYDAAEDQGWNLTIACGSHEAASIGPQFEQIGAKVLTEIRLEEHQELLANASAYVISLKEEYISAGQIRVMNAIRAGVPIVASRVVGLEGYLSDGRTALLFEPGDHLGCRLAVNRLISDPVLQQTLVNTAFNEARERSFEKYLISIHEFIHAMPARVSKSLKVK
jgi:hypothetical protein